MKAKSWKLKSLLASALMAVSSAALSGPILIFTDVKQPSLVREHFSSDSWLVTETTTEVQYHATGIIADGQSYSWNGDAVGRIFLTFTPDGEPTTANYIGAELSGDSTRSLLRGPFAPDEGQLFSSNLLPGAQHSQLVFIFQPRVWQDPAQHGLAGDGVIREAGAANASVVDKSADIPEPGSFALMLCGCFALWYGRLHAGRRNLQTHHA